MQPDLVLLQFIQQFHGCRYLLVGAKTWSRHMGGESLKFLLKDALLCRIACLVGGINSSIALAFPLFYLAMSVGLSVEMAAMLSLICYLFCFPAVSSLVSIISKRLSVFFSACSIRV